MSTLEELAKEAASCTRCDLYQRATATVFGEGRPHSPLALVGEQPGDQEDKQGHPKAKTISLPVVERYCQQGDGRTTDFLGIKSAVDEILATGIEAPENPRR